MGDRISHQIPHLGDSPSPFPKGHIEFIGVAAPFLTHNTFSLDD